MLRSAYFWIVAVPMAAKLFEAIESGSNFVIPGTSISITLSLPFSWKVFFLSALLTSLGNLIYSLTCPAIIRDYSNFRDFENQGEGADKLRRLFEELIMKYQTQLSLEHLKKTLDDFADSFSEPISKVPLRKTESHLRAVEFVSKIKFKREFLGDAFGRIRDLAEYLSKCWRGTCCACYFLGLCFISIVLSQNIMFVFREIIKDFLS